MSNKNKAKVKPKSNKKDNEIKVTMPGKIKTMIQQRATRNMRTLQQEALSLIIDGLHYGDSNRDKYL